ncbi:MAG: hypothetical protein ACRC53_04360 [Plesiomonas sp.]|uniref:hypothetical protein n=1 Tax=Plesiomonas sp. TaxID=2486279 RepID=UPI003F416024
MADSMISFITPSSYVFSTSLPLFISVLLATVLMATLTLSLMRGKGQICPGQRRRLVKQSYVLTFLWGVFSALCIAAINESEWLIGLAISTTCVHFFSLYTIKQLSISTATRWADYCNKLSAILAISTAILFIDIWPKTFGLLISTLLTLGAVFTHLLMVAARCRLQAFHRLLPFTGFVGIFITCGNTVYQALHTPVNVIYSTILMVSITVRLILLAAGFLIWVWPLIMYHQYTNVDDVNLKEKSTPSKQRLISVILLYLTSAFLAMFI